MKKLKKTAVITIFALGFVSAKGLEEFERIWGLNIFPSSAQRSIENVLGGLKDKKPAAFKPKIDPAPLREEKIKGYEVCFNPPGGCAELIVKTIEKAKTQTTIKGNSQNVKRLHRRRADIPAQGADVFASNGKIAVCGFFNQHAHYLQP